MHPIPNIFVLVMNVQFFSTVMFIDKIVAPRKVIFTIILELDIRKLYCRISLHKKNNKETVIIEIVETNPNEFDMDIVFQHDGTQPHYSR